MYIYIRNKTRVSNRRKSSHLRNVLVFNVQVHSCMRIPENTRNSPIKIRTFEGRMLAYRSWLYNRFRYERVSITIHKRRGWQVPMCEFERADNWIAQLSTYEGLKRKRDRAFGDRYIRIPEGILGLIHNPIRSLSLSLSLFCKSPIYLLTQCVCCSYFAKGTFSLYDTRNTDAIVCVCAWCI